MSVSRGEVEHIASLARLRVGPEEIATLTGEMNAILDHMAELREVDVDGIPEVVGVVEGGAPTRSPHTGGDPLQRSPAEFAPDWRDGFFVVPRLPAMDGHLGDAGDDREEGP